MRSSGVRSSSPRTTRTETPMTRTPSPHITDVVAVAIPVTDQNRARDFYVGVLGLQEHEDIVVGDGFRWIELRAVGSPVGIALVPRQPEVPVGVDTGIRLAVSDARAIHNALMTERVHVGEL